MTDYTDMICAFVGFLAGAVVGGFAVLVMVGHILFVRDLSDCSD